MFPALHTYSFRRRFEDEHQTFFDAVDWAAEHGFRGIEMMVERGDRPGPVTGLPDQERSTITRAVNYARRRGVPVLAFSTYNDFAATGSGAVARQQVFLGYWIQLAADFGVPRLRLLTGYYRETPDRREQERRTCEAIAATVAIAAAAGVELAVENHSSIFSSAADLVALARAHRPALALCPDPTNWVHGYFHAATTARESIYHELAIAASHATHAHLKIRGLDSNDGLVGYDLVRLLRILRDAGFRGGIAFESVTFDPDRPGDLLADLPAARARVDRTISKVLRETDTCETPDSPQ